MYFQPEDNHERIIAKRGKFFKKLKVQTRVENDFSFSLLRETEEVEMSGEKWWGKQSYLETSREDVREAHTILAS